MTALVLARQTVLVEAAVLELLQVIGVAVVLFATTNVDDIFVLVTFFADPRYRPRQIVLGQFLGIGALIALSAAGSLLALVAPGEHIGLLGLVPLALGIHGLIKRWRKADTGGDDGERASARGGATSVALVTFANGGDNIGAYVPVFATRTPLQLVLTVAVFLAMTALWCWVGHRLVSHPALGPKLRRLAAPLTPFVLIAIGVLIILESRAYRLVLG